MKSWKTTLVGAAFAGMAIISAAKKPSWGEALKDQHVQMELAAAVLAVLTKDHDVTGGNRGK